MDTSDPEGLLPPDVRQVMGGSLWFSLLSFGSCWRAELVFFAELSAESLSSSEATSLLSLGLWLGALVLA